VATDKELEGLFKGSVRTWREALRAAYNLGRKHGAAAAQPAPPVAPVGGLVERVEMAVKRSYTLENDWSAEARAAIREMTVWMRENYDLREVYGAGWANLIAAIEDEAAQ
jgi:hypothetical protein